jgi:hypothetical protein
MISTRTTILLAVVIAMFAAPATSAAREPTSDDRAATVKAGMVLNFIRYTEWPPRAFATDQSPIVMTILGDGGIAGSLERTVKNQQVHGRNVEIRSLTYPKLLAGETEVSQDRLRAFRGQLLSSHVVFICDSERDRLKAILQDLDGSDILTVSDLEDFAERGGMLGLAIRSDKVAFDANPGRIQATQLKVSSQLLRLARTVKSRDH